MKQVYGYIRVSTTKQGEGVSLEAQKEAIEYYAQKHELNIINWFEEKETAAKTGRPLFTQMTKLLKKRKADGVIIHKIDRSARNLRDWASLGDLIDEGVEIHFAHESLDLNARSGRLSADIQAVIAADYIRNLREETKKGLYGRLKQGLYPFRAPVGYLNNGKGKLKTIDPIKGPLIKMLFELYATGSYTQIDIRNEAKKLGLTNDNGNLLSKNTISTILNNPFYSGVIKVKEEIFKGIHEPLISTKTFQKVQDVLEGKTHTKVIKHSFLFRKLLRCSACNYLLIGEKQKGIVYYRCHTKNCVTKGIREDYIERRIVELFENIEFEKTELILFEEIIKFENKHQEKHNIQIKDTLQIKIAEHNHKLEKLTDAIIEGLIDKDVFQERKIKLVYSLKELEEKQVQLSQRKNENEAQLQKFLELSKTLKNSYISANQLEKRLLVSNVTSNLLVEGKKLVIAMVSPFKEMVKSQKMLKCSHFPNHPRKKNGIYANSSSLHFIIEQDTVINKKKSLTKSQLRALIPHILIS